MRVNGNSLFLLTATLFLIGTVQAQSQASLLDQGQSEARAGRIEAALLHYAEFRRIQPEDPRSYVYSAQAMVDTGRIHDAEIEIGEALNLPVLDGQLAYQVGRILLKLERPQFVPQVLDPFLGSGRIGPKSLELLAESYLEQRRFEESLSVLDRLASSAPLGEKSLLLKGKVLVGLNRLDQALEVFEKVAQQNPASAEAFDQLSLVSLRGNNPEAAKKMALAAVQIEPDNPTYLHQLGQSCKALGQEGEAIPYLERAIELGGTGSQIYFDLGDSYRKTGERTKARAALAEYQQHLNRLRGEQEITQMIAEGEQALTVNDTTRAKEVFKRVLERDPDNWIAHNRLAKVLLFGGDSKNAIDHIRKLLELDGKSSEAEFLTALYWYGEKNFVKARPHAEAARRLRPGHAECRSLMGNLLLLAGDQEGALEEYKAAMELSPSKAEFRRSYEILSHELKKGPVKTGWLQ